MGLLLITLENTGQEETASSCATADVDWMLIKISSLKGQTLKEVLREVDYSPCLKGVKRLGCGTCGHGLVLGLDNGWIH